MAFTLQYRSTAKCDTCGKTETVDSVDVPLSSPVPEHWVQASPPGTHQLREFCSEACVASHKPAPKPWEA